MQSDGGGKGNGPREAKKRETLKGKEHITFPN